MEQETVSIRIPFPTKEQAEIVYKVLAVDKEKGEIKREMSTGFYDESESERGCERTAQLHM
jgi:hypothetical protein